MGKIKLFNDQILTIIADGVQDLEQRLLLYFTPEDKTLAEFETIFSNKDNIQKIYVLDSEGEVFHCYDGFTKLVGLEKIYRMIVDYIQNELTEDTPIYGSAVKVTLQQPDATELATDYFIQNQPILEASLLVARTTAQTFNDAQALSVQDIYEYWAKDVKYPVDYKVNYLVGGQPVLFRCLKEHTSQATWTPDTAASLWAKVLIPDPEVIPDWEQPLSTNGYKKGDKVKHQNKTWESLVDNNVWEPGAVGTEGQWKEVTE